MPPVDLVVFDMAGTTVRDAGGAVGRCLQQALAAAGVPVSPEAVNARMGLPKPEAIRQLLGAAAEPARVAAVHADFSERMIRHYAGSPEVGEVPGAGRVFARLRAAGVRVALDTGFHRAIVTVVLQRLGWREGETVDASIASDEVPRGRPHPDMIRTLMERLGVGDPRRVAKVGDAPADLEEGRAAGCGIVIGVTGGSHPREALERCPHTHLVETIAEVPALLGL